MTGPLPWYVARSGGLVAYVLLAATALWGAGLAARALRNRPGLPWMYGMHRFLGLLTLVFVGIHVTAVLIDQYVRFSVLNVLVPMTSHWRPGAVAWGVVSLYLVLAVSLSGLLKRRWPRRARRLWKPVHMISYALLATSTVHLYLAGTDARQLPVLVGAAGLLTAVLATWGHARAQGWQRRQQRSSGSAQAPSTLPAISEGSG